MSGNEEDLGIRKGNAGSGEDEGHCATLAPTANNKKALFGTFRQSHAGVLGVSPFSSVAPVVSKSL